MAKMIPSRIRRVRVLATALLGITMLWLWSRNIGETDPYAYRKHLAQQAIGGGAVLRPAAQEAPVAPPSLLESDMWTEPVKPLRPPIPKYVPSPVTKPIAEEEDDEEENFVKEELQHDQAPPAVAPPKPSPPTLQRISPNGHGLGPGLHPGDIGQGRKEVAVSGSHTAKPTAHWSKLPENYPISSTIQLPVGTSKPFPQIQRERNKLTMYGADREKLLAVRAAAMRTWEGYRQYAFGHDELRPVSGGFKDPFMGWGATLVDGLDTLWVMGLREEFEEAVEAVAKIDFTTSLRSEIPLFETVIRYLGGLIAAYDVSGKSYRVLLDKSVELAEILYGAFDTPNRVPITFYNWKPESVSREHRASGRIVLAEIGTLSMEFTRLAQLTGEPKYYDAIARLTDLLEEWQDKTRIPGMWPTSLDGSGCGRPPPEKKTTPTVPLTPEQKAPQVAPGVVAHADSSRNGPLRPPASVFKSNERLTERPPSLVSPGDGLAGLGMPGKLDEQDIGHVAPQQIDPKYHGNIVKRQLEDKVPTGYVGRDYGSVEYSEDDEDTLSSLQLRARPVIEPVTVQSLHEQDNCIPQGLASTSKNTAETYTLSGASDSMYEYLPKEYILLGGQVEKYKNMYLKSMDIVIEKLLYKPMTEDERDALMTGAVIVRPNYSEPMETRGYEESFTPEITHLVCFAGGMFAMGGVLFDKPEHVEIGAKITEGCVWAYNVTDSGIMPETATVMQCDSIEGECKWNETAWWEALDPLAHSRPTTASRLAEAQKAAHTVPQADPIGLNTEPQSDPIGFKIEPQSDPIGMNPYPQPDLRKNDVSPDDSHERLGSILKKRQLEALPDDTQQHPAPPTPQSPASIPESPALSPAQPAQPAAYTPPTQLTHEEYIAKRLKDEHIPPGFTRLSGHSYLLRPEAIESVFYMYRITGDPHWREVGWDMFTAVETHARTHYGYSAIDDVLLAEPTLNDQMESFWLAETLKYFYLLYDDPDTWSLDEWVLNTEAHLFRRPEFEFAPR